MEDGFEVGINCYVKVCREDCWYTEQTGSCINLNGSDFVESIDYTNIAMSDPGTMNS